MLNSKLLLYKRVTHDITNHHWFMIHHYIDYHCILSLLVYYHSLSPLSLIKHMDNHNLFICKSTIINYKWAMFNSKVLRDQKVPPGNLT